jgi:hypothetical protein
MLRGLALDGDLEELCQRLLSALVLEGKYRDNLQKLTHCSALEACIIALLHKIPDILHAENRIGIKLMTMVLMEGFSNALERKIYATSSSAKERINAYQEQIEQIMNREVLGDDDGPAQWSAPMHDNRKTVGTITLDNNRFRLVLENFERLIAISISVEIRQNK